MNHNRQGYLGREVKAALPFKVKGKSMEINYNELSPMMQHYLKTKEENPGCILFYRLGDFYEMFFEDAEIVSSELDLTLTGKACGLKERAPMCGVPFHACDVYITKLVDKGYRVAICEQVEDPKTAKGMVKREVIRVVTPGTNMSEQKLEEGSNNFLVAVFFEAGRPGLAYADVSTGDYFVTEADSIRKLRDEIARIAPSEIICNEAFFDSGIDITDLRGRLRIAVNAIDASYFSKQRAQEALLSHFKASTLAALGIDGFLSGSIAAGALLLYLKDTQKTDMSHFLGIKPYLLNTYMLLDMASRRNLELTETLREKQKRGSLLWVLDKTCTAMGSRLLKNMIEQPLVEAGEINKRLDGVTALYERVIDREEIREYLKPIYDLERLLGRISYRSANPRDLIAFKCSLKTLPALKRLLDEEFDGGILSEIKEGLDGLEDLYELIDRAIVEEPPLAMKDGGIIKPGYNEEADRLRNAGSEGKNWLAELEEKDRERTGIKNLKIKFNKVFGYYYEVTNSFKSLVPEDYVRKQTLAGAERYTNDKLKELEDIILNSQDRLSSLEYELFAQVREKIYVSMERVQRTARSIALLDALTSLAQVADKNNYVRPAVNTDGIIDIKEGRHPVVEQMLQGDSFIPNDIYLDNDKKRISVITGPNMAGKSTYMRQCAIITLMACIGSYVPAKSANICVCDRIFTRVGASDDLASGQSTFMVEMTEVANILRNASSRSLLILDEIGRGTATFDGLAIAWAVIEHIADKKKIGAKTLFATHYHELTELEGKLKGVNNYCIQVKEQGEKIIFLRKIIRGGADKSYGIQVARLAGVPRAVVDRANELINQLSTNDITAKIKDIAELGKAREKLDGMEMAQLTFFDTRTDEDILKEIGELDISNMTPVEALLTLEKLQSRINNRYKP